jgi:transcriptional regulator of acetoin/glycerol metabolism
MAGPSTTLTYSSPGVSLLDGPPEPGIALAFHAGRPAFHAAPLSNGTLEIVRGELKDAKPGVLPLDDERVSRKHVTVAHEAGLWRFTDHESRNGTWLDARELKGMREVQAARVLRCGSSLLLPIADIRPYLRQSVELRGEWVLGPKLQRAWESVDKIAAVSETLHLLGESGTGKELAAHHFHEKGDSRTFVAVNCAGIPEGIAERLLFGAKKGAYSGIERDADGYLQAADGGTLFLDEVGELEGQVQAKLLRALETREVLPLGATKGQEVRFRLCSATHRDLRDDVTRGAFREDLYFRLGRPAVELPPLRERLEEIPWLLARAVRDPHVTLVEACLLRHWPGNVRELLLEAKAAVASAGEARVTSEHLAADAGTAFEEKADAAPIGKPSDAVIREALERHRGNVSAASRALKMHRTQLRRWMAKNGVKGE